MIIFRWPKGKMTMDYLVIFHLSRLCQVEKCLLPVRRRGVRRGRKSDSVGELDLKPEGEAVNFTGTDRQYTEIAVDLVARKFVVAEVQIKHLGTVGNDQFWLYQVYNRLSAHRLLQW